MEIFTLAIASPVPGAPPSQGFITINGQAAELEGLMMAIQRALAGGPQVYETRLTNGIPVRIVIDRLGAAQQGA